MLNKYNKTSLGFILIIALVILTGIFSVRTVKMISAETERLYKHPFTVSNAAREIKTNMISMHRYMKDVVLAENSKQLETANALVSTYEAKVFGNFRIIFERFLGDKQKIYRVYQSFVAWRDIRNEVIALKRAEKFQAAAEITKGKGAEHVRLLTEQTQELVDFATIKAAEFLRKSHNDARESVIVMSILASLAVLVSFAIAIYIVRSQKQAETEIRKRSHLIDQNIMIAHLDPKGVILEISNALCRYLGLLRKKLINSPSHLFISDYDDNELEISIWRNLKTGTHWRGEIKLVTEGGGIKWAEMTVLPNLNEKYDIEGYTCILQDVTSKKLSLTDNLTALGNRRQYEEILVREINLAKRNDSHLTLAIIDIDFFKNYNDRYGHPQGDIALARVGTALMSCMHRPNDYIFRIGGEEFAVLFSSLGREDSRSFLETIRHSVEKLNISHDDSSVSDHLTISIGGVTLNGASLLDAKHFYIEADKALYLAKETRNQTVMA